MSSRNENQGLGKPIRVTTIDPEFDLAADRFLANVHGEDQPITISGKIIDPSSPPIGLQDLPGFARDSHGSGKVLEHRTFESGSVRDNDDDKPLVNHLDPYLRLRFGYLLRAGARKYNKGNWKLGQDTETALESLHRHLAKYELNLNAGIEQDEDHLSSVVFNIMLIMKNEEKSGIPVDHYYGTTK
jgi:hypothetical protein